jgi:predicted nucleic acid-binding protein
MTSTPPTGPPRVFIDSSVLFAAALSSTGSARELIITAARGQIDLVFSRFVLDETERNLAAKAPRALPFFHTLRRLGIARTVDPSASLVRRVAKVVVTKDAPIVAGAINASAPFLASYDRKHLHAQAALIRARFGIDVAVPDDILRRLTGS